MSGLNRANNVPLGVLRYLEKFPHPDLPEWANLFGKRMVDMGVSIPNIRKSIEAMEIERRARFRASIGPHVPVTEFDEHLEEMFSKFYIRDVK